MSMTDAAKQFLESTFKGDKEAWRAVACEAIKGQADLLDAIRFPEGFSIDWSGLKYEVKEESGDSGKVGISGTVKITRLGMSQEQNIQDAGFDELPMKREGGSWKACPQNITN
ncbi:MAG: hypothetical protein CUN51_03215 [Candidatus Thermofonsia Clade 1 bacterium]|uniref:Uncharacterized protein n=1 Tax=Candidatus Thermofonsia Clade 1 bacterium TaxID=2364210 RepID=A0A2M8P348_9CHLR|nr:MAG: hypothetical protein CUN51_03215 [Candidatus Thermofonsia Clade 1 bacterium]